MAEMLPIHSGPQTSSRRRQKAAADGCRRREVLLPAHRYQY